MHKTRAIQTKRAEKPPQTSTAACLLPSRRSSKPRMHGAIEPHLTRNLSAIGQKRLDMRPKLCYFCAWSRRKNGFVGLITRRVGSTPNIAAPLFQIAPNNLQTPLSNTLIAFGGSIQKIFMRSPPRAEYAHRNSNVHGLKIL